MPFLWCFVFQNQFHKQMSSDKCSFEPLIRIVCFSRWLVFENNSRSTRYYTVSWDFPVSCICWLVFHLSSCTSLLSVQVMLFLTVFHHLFFCPASLMEAYAEKVIASPDALTLQDLLCVLKVYSSLNCDLQHHRQQWVTRMSPNLSHLAC